MYLSTTMHIKIRDVGISTLIWCAIFENILDFFFSLLPRELRRRVGGGGGKQKSPRDRGELPASQNLAGIVSCRPLASCLFLMWPADLWIIGSVSFNIPDLSLPHPLHAPQCLFYNQDTLAVPDSFSLTLLLDEIVQRGRLLYSNRILFNG